MEDKRQEFVLGELSELRIEVAHKSRAVLKLVSGKAETFGAELSHEAKTLEGTNLAVFTFHGCKLMLEGRWASAYVATDTPNPFFLNVHAALEERRRAPRGPRVLVVGPTDSGKSSLCMQLVNYAVREKHSPVFVDLDVGQGSLGVPGCLAAARISTPCFPNEEIEALSPLALYFGHVTPSQSLPVFRAQVDALAALLQQRCDKDKQLSSVGYIVNTCGWVDGEGFDLLLDAARALSIDHVLVLGQERLHHRLLDSLQGSGVTVLAVPKSGGVVTRETHFRRQSRNGRIRTYFYGIKQSLCPFTVVLHFTPQQGEGDPYRIFKIGGSPQAPAHALPIGAVPSLNPISPTEERLSNELKRCVLAVSWATEPDDLLASNVAGFVTVVEVDLEKQRLTVLAPSYTQLPSRLLILGSLKYVEESES